MHPKKHWAIFIDNTSNKSNFITKQLKDNPPYIKELIGQKGLLFSKIAIYKYIEEEEIHDNKILTQDASQSLKSMSSGEQKKALLKHLLQLNPDYLILDNPFDNLDISYQDELKTLLLEVCKQISIVQIVSRKTDVLPFISNHAQLRNETLSFFTIDNNDSEEKDKTEITISTPIPAPITKISYTKKYLIEFKNVNVFFEEKPILHDINWSIKPGEFWQLKGKNGSGKTTILSMITGDNPKGYGQNLFLFGQKKGSGESIWDIREKIGYFTPSMTDKFMGQHSVEHMLISGLFDSIGLYKYPTEIQLRLAKDWLELIGMWELRKTYFRNLSMGQKRLVMIARAMIKHPLLLILDEPTAGLDDNSAQLFTHLVNKIAQESTTAILYVSHRKEAGLKPQYTYELQMSSTGSTGKAIKIEHS